MASKCGTHLDCITLHFSQFPLVVEGGAGALELLGELLGVGLQPHAAQLVLHLANLQTHFALSHLPSIQHQKMKKYIETAYTFPKLHKVTKKCL